MRQRRRTATETLAGTNGEAEHTTELARRTVNKTERHVSARTQTAQSRTKNQGQRPTSAITNSDTTSNA